MNNVKIDNFHDVTVGNIYLLRCEPELLWQVVGIYLGGVGQESLVQLKPLSRNMANVAEYSKMDSFIPIELMEEMLKADILQLIYSRK